MRKSAETAWLFVWLLLGITAVTLVGSFLLGRPHNYSFIGKVWVHVIGFCALNGAYVSFKAAITGLEPDRPSLTRSTGVRSLMFLSGLFVVALVWGGLWVVG